MLRSNHMSEIDTAPRVHHDNHESLLQRLSQEIKFIIDEYIYTHGETGTPTSLQVDMPRLRSCVDDLLVVNCPRVFDSIVAYQKVVESNLAESDLLLLNLATSDPDKTHSVSEVEKDRIDRLMLSLDEMMFMVVMRKLAKVMKESDEILALSCDSLVGFMMMVLGDLNDGEIPEGYIDTLRACDIQIEKMDEASVAALNIDGLSLEELSNQMERRQRAVFCTE